MLNRDKNVWMFILHGVFDEYYIFFTDGTWTAAIMVVIVW
jgi:hypothetical protein